MESDFAKTIEPKIPLFATRGITTSNVNHVSCSLVGGVVEAGMGCSRKERGGGCRSDVLFYKLIPFKQSHSMLCLPQSICHSVFVPSSPPQCSFFPFLHFTSEFIGSIATSKPLKVFHLLVGIYVKLPETVRLNQTSWEDTCLLAPSDNKEW